MRTTTSIQAPSSSSITLSARETLLVLGALELTQLLDGDSDRLLFQTQAGEIQRNVDVDHLSDLKQYQADHLDRHGCYSFGTQIVVAEYGGKYALVDGQHRLETLRYLLNVDFAHAEVVCVPVLVVRLNAVSEYDELFVAVNKNKPVRLYHNVYEWKTVLKHLEQYFQTHYRPYLKTTDTPVVPHLNLDKLMRYLDEGDFVRRLGLGYEELLKEIERLNTFYHLHGATHIKRKYITQKETWLLKCKQKQPERPLYLGMYRQFEWVDRILLRVTQPDVYPSYEAMPHVPLNYRATIGKALRRNVWKKRHPTQFVGACYVCAKPIEFDEFECGHKVAVFVGGPTTCDNLEPVCKLCNADMGVEHLDVFKARLLEEGGGWVA